MKFFYAPYIISIFLMIIIGVAYIYQDTEYILEENKIVFSQDITNLKYQWPVIGYNKITSQFGYRQSPTAGASTYHSGIDVAAPKGSNLVSSITGKVIFTGFKGANGHTIIISNDNVEITYSLVDSKYYPNVGDFVLKGEVIGKVGPKNIYDVENNPYKDSKGEPTNGATTGPHLHFSIKVDGKYVNPLLYITE